MKFTSPATRRRHRAWVLAAALTAAALAALTALTACSSSPGAAHPSPHLSTHPWRDNEVH